MLSSPTPEPSGEDVSSPILSVSAPEVPAEQPPSRPPRRRLRARFRAALSWFVQNTIPFVPVLIFTWRNEAEVTRETSSFDLSDEMRKSLALGESTIRDMHRFELSRREQLQRRAQAYLIAVTIAASFVFGLLGIGNRLPSTGELKHGVSAILILLIFYLAMAGFSALNIIRPDGVFEINLQAHREILEYRIDIREYFIKYIYLNQSIVLRHACWSNVCYVSMRNAFLGIFGILLLLVVGGSPLLFMQTKSQNPPNSGTSQTGIGMPKPGGKSDLHVSGSPPPIQASIPPPDAAATATDNAASSPQRAQTSLVSPPLRTEDIGPNAISNKASKTPDSPSSKKMGSSSRSTKHR